MPTTTAHRQDLLKALGGDPSGVYTTTSAGSTSTLISTQFKSTLLPADYLDGCWVFVPTATAPRQRRMPKSGLTVASGTLTVDDVFGSAIGSGVDFEVSARLPLVNEGPAGMGGSSLMGCLNLGLGHLWVPGAETLALVTGQNAYSLASWAYIDRPERLVGVRQTGADGTSRIPTTRSWELRGDPDDAGYEIHFAQPFVFTGSQSVYLVTRQPADRKIRVGGTWTLVADGRGLSAESDESGVDLTTATTAALVFCYRALATRPGPQQQLYRELYADQLAEARRLRFWDHTRDTLEPRPQAAPPQAQTEAPS